MKQLGFEKPPQNWDQLLAFGKAAKAGGQFAVMLPAAGGEVTALHILSMFWGLGGEMVDDAGKPIFFEGDNRDALEQVYSRSEEHTSELQSLMRISYAVFCLKKKKTKLTIHIQ